MSQDQQSHSNQPLSQSQRRSSAANFMDSLSNRKNSILSASPEPELASETLLYDSSSVQLVKRTFVDHTSGRCQSSVTVNKPLISGVPGTAQENRQKRAGTEGIFTVGILRRAHLHDCLILVKKFRPSLKSYSLEFPARIVEHNPESDEHKKAEPVMHGPVNLNDQKSAGEAAVQDVADATGYRSTKVEWVSPETAMGPDLTDEKRKLVSVLIDGDDPIMNNFYYLREDPATTVPGESEGPSLPGMDCMGQVEVLAVPVNGLLDRLDTYSAEGTVIDSRVYSFAIGLKRGEKLAQSVANPENIEVAL